MSTETNKAIVRRFFEEYTPAVIDELLALDYQHHDPALPPELQRGRAAYQQVVAMFYTAFPDLRTTVEETIAEGDTVVARWVSRGTHKGELMGIPGTGRQVAMKGISTHRVTGGKIAETWVNFDALGMLQQLGAIPAPTGAT